MIVDTVPYKPSMGHDYLNALRPPKRMQTIPEDREIKSREPRRKIMRRAIETSQGYMFLRSITPGYPPGNV